MGLGVENSVNAYNQNYRYQQNKTTGQANHLDFNKILSAKEGDNTEKVVQFFLLIDKKSTMCHMEKDRHI